MSGELNFEHRTYVDWNISRLPVIVGTSGLAVPLGANASGVASRDDQFPDVPCIGGSTLHLGYRTGRFSALGPVPDKSVQGSSFLW